MKVKECFEIENMYKAYSDLLDISEAEWETLSLEDKERYLKKIIND